MFTWFDNIWQNYSFTNAVYSDVKIACPYIHIFCNYCTVGNQNTVRLHFYNVSLCLTAIVWRCSSMACRWQTAALQRTLRSISASTIAYVKLRPWSVTCKHVPGAYPRSCSQLGSDVARGHFEGERVGTAFPLWKCLKRTGTQRGSITVVLHFQT